MFVSNFFFVIVVVVVLLFFFVEGEGVGEGNGFNSDKKNLI